MWSERAWRRLSAGGQQPGTERQIWFQALQAAQAEASSEEPKAQVLPGHRRPHWCVPPPKIPNHESIASAAQLHHLRRQLDACVALQDEARERWRETGQVAGRELQDRGLQRQSVQRGQLRKIRLNLRQSDGSAACRHGETMTVQQPPPKLRALPPSQLNHRPGTHPQAPAPLCIVQFQLLQRAHGRSPRARDGRDAGRLVRTRGGMRAGGSEPCA